MDVALLVFLVIEINVDPTMAEFGPFTLTWHGFFIGVGIIAGVVLAIWLARRDGIPSDVGQELALVAVPSAIVGARLFYVIEHWGDYFPDNIPDIALGISEGGLTLYGGLIGGVAAGVLYALWQKWPVGIALDAAAVGMILGQALGRIGDLMSGERLATETGLPWAVSYTHPDTLGQLGVEVHPVAAYELIGGLVILALLLFALRPRVKVPGWVFCAYAGMYGLLRFALSDLRVDEQTIGDVPVAAIVSALVVGAAVIAAGVLYRRPGPITPEWADRVWGPEAEDEEPPKPAGRKAVRA